MVHLCDEIQAVVRAYIFCQAPLIKFVCNQCYQTTDIFIYLLCIALLVPFWVDCHVRFPGMDLFATQSFKEKLANKIGQRTLMKQVAFDNFVHYTFLYFPVFYILKELIQEREGGLNPLSLVTDGLSKYKENFIEDNLAMWAIWIPCDIIIYAIPIWMRLPSNHLISLCWCILLSFMRGKTHEDQGHKDLSN